MFGVGADWQAMDTLMLTGSYLYVKNEGNATFGVQNNLAITPAALPINNFDNSKQQYINLKGVWNYNRNWSFTGGYSYMKYSHDDIATDGYQYVLPIVSQWAPAARHPGEPEQQYAELPQRLRRVHGRAQQHLLPVRHVQVRRAAAAGAREGRASAAPRRSSRRLRRRRRRRLRPPRRHPPRRCRRSRLTRRCCSTSTRRS